jgi:hypothetical protein
MGLLSINDNLVRLINGVDCHSGSLLLFSRIEVSLEDLDPMSGDHLCTINLDEPQPIIGEYEIPSDLDLKAFLARRGSDGETLFLTAQEI